EPGGVGDVAHVDRVAVDAVAGQPAAVVGEVGADRTHQDRAEAEQTHAEGDVRGDPAPPDREVVDEERQRHLVQLVGQELLGEAAREMHQVIGRNRTGDDDLHGNLDDGATGNGK